MNQQSKPPEVPQIIMYPKERYQGQNALEYEALEKQINYHTWGALVFQVLIISSAVVAVLTACSLIAGFLGMVYLRQLLDRLSSGLRGY